MCILGIDKDVLCDFGTFRLRNVSTWGRFISFLLARLNIGSFTLVMFLLSRDCKWFVCFPRCTVGLAKYFSVKLRLLSYQSV